ncbi:hypothetical protein [Clavibacter zhangzhiyongii]|uniref:hypothetical protein n=1 Tax=Clavibacter zhangzhiyongii TaxID=2768071 RepID=UPI0039E16B06
MAVLSAERGGDPERPGKRDPLDPLLWRAERAGEPAWDSVVGRGRPGWHIECAVIALRKLDRPVTVQGGGSDLIFPHHEMSAGHAAALTGEDFACVYAHTGMVAYQGEKMSKSLGNLVLVSRLRTAGVDPRAIRLALLAQHHRADWEWTDALLEESVARLAAWDAWAAEAASGDAPALEDAPGELVELVRERLADDLDTPGAILLLDLRVATDVPATPVEVDAVDALLGVAPGEPGGLIRVRGPAGPDAGRALRVGAVWLLVLGVLGAATAPRGRSSPRPRGPSPRRRYRSNSCAMASPLASGESTVSRGPARAAGCRTPCPRPHRRAGRCRPPTWPPPRRARRAGSPRRPSPPACR